MAIPDFQTIMHPLLKAHDDGEEHVNRDLVNHISELFKLSDEERREMLPSGRAKLIDNRVGWAKTHMAQAGLIESPRRGISVITERGRYVLKHNPERVDMNTLKEFDAYQEFRDRKKPILEKDSDTSEPDESGSSQTPEELLENAYLDARKNIESQLLNLVLKNEPSFMERVVVDLVIQMGYGGSRKDAGEALGPQSLANL
jgi:restriction system protein